MALPRALAAGVLALSLTCCGGGHLSSPAAGDRPGTGPVSPTPGTAQPGVADRDADRLAGRLRALDRALDGRGTSPSGLRRAGERQQLLLRALGRRPGEERRVLGLLPPGQRTRTRETLLAGHLLRSMYPASPHGLPRRLPAWRIERPSPAPELWAAYHAAQRRFGVGWSYLAAINMVESAFGRVHGLSTAGARGPMQFIPATWRAYGAGGDVRDPRDAILGAARLLSANGFSRAPLAALRHYNDSAAYARAVTLLAEVMRGDPREFLAFYHWRVFYLTARGSILLPVGYAERHGVGVGAWLRRHPRALVIR